MTSLLLQAMTHNITLVEVKIKMFGERELAELIQISFSLKPSWPLLISHNSEKQTAWFMRCDYNAQDSSEYKYGLLNNNNKLDASPIWLNL